MALLACSKSQPLEPMQVGSNADLAAHSAEFKREVVKVTDGVYAAIGFGLANVILLEGDDGMVIVDTMESEQAAERVKEALDKITKKPVKAIIYTHFHSDHTFGATVFARGNKPDIYAHESALYYLDQTAGVTAETTYRRATRQFGTRLPQGGLVNCGIGPFLDFSADNTVGLVRPNITFTGERRELEVAGLRLELVHAPGETNDQIFIWMPGKKVLLPADNFYRSFPNLYTIRGTAYRDVTQWVNSLDKMRALRPEYLVPSHTRPLTGADKIYEILTNYRDAIQFVHDQTIRNMNMGFSPEETVERVKLPAHLARLPYLQEYYGTVEWSVRGIYDGYLGWFGGNATDLFPLSPQEKARRFAELAGGEPALLARAKQAAAQGDHQWVLVIADLLLALDPDHAQARDLKARSLTALGEKQIAATARNYYLTQALEVARKLKIEKRKTKESEKNVVDSMPLKAIFSGMAVHLDPAKSADVDKVIGFRFPDTGETYTLHVRRGVAEVQPQFPDHPEIVVTVASTVWKEIAAQIRNPALSMIKGEIKVEGGILDLIKLMSLFQTE